MYRLFQEVLDEAKAPSPSDNLRTHYIATAIVRSSNIPKVESWYIEYRAALIYLLDLQDAGYDLTALELEIEDQQSRSVV